MAARVASNKSIVASSKNRAAGGKNCMLLDWPFLFLIMIAWRWFFIYCFFQLLGSGSINGNKPFFKEGYVDFCIMK